MENSLMARQELRVAQQFGIVSQGSGVILEEHGKMSHQW